MMIEIETLVGLAILEFVCGMVFQFGISGFLRSARKKRGRYDD